MKHCTTERMIADFFTKPLQGKLFRFIRDIVMGLAPFPVKESAGFYEISDKKLFVEECFFNQIKDQPVNNDKKILWAEIVKKGKRVNEVV